jgi:hypothetical protein
MQSADPEMIGKRGNRSAKGYPALENKPIPSVAPRKL